MKGTHIVCLDPGHGPGCVNGSPDGSYKEREFTWDMARRIKPLLEKAGVEVILTRKEGEKPSLTDRAYVSDRYGAHLLVSLHSNATGKGGWDTPSGLLIYTSAAGEEAGRNKAARAVLKRMEQAGVKLFGGGLAHERWTVIVKAEAPAMLIEYGFHTNESDVALLKDPEYRDRLAKATAAGILDYLGVAVDREDAEEGLDNIPDPWAKDAVQKALAGGVLRGSDAGDLGLHTPVDKQTLTVILDRLGLLDKTLTTREGE